MTDPRDGSPTDSDRSATPGVGPARLPGTEAGDAVEVTYILEDPRALTGTDQAEWKLTAKSGENLLDLALQNGINIEHACGGVCACSTCHVYVEAGMDAVAEATEDEEDRVDEAPAVQRNSRLSCQCVILRTGTPIRVRVPGWNRNAVKETPH